VSAARLITPLGRLPVATPAPASQPSPTVTNSPTTTLRGGTDNECLESPRTTTDFTPAVAASCRGEPGQQWTRTSTGQITVDEGTECLDAYAGGTSDGTAAGVYPCDGGTNEQWTFYTDGTMELQDCSDGANQQWKTV
jgi:hypothetical protein